MKPSEFDEWSDIDRGEAMALIYHEDETRCLCGCGQYADEAHSRDYNWDVNPVKCYAGQAIDITRRIEGEKNKGVKGWDDGLLWTARPIPRD